MFYVTSQFVFEIRKREKEAYLEFERVGLKVVVRTHKAEQFHCRDRVDKGRQLNDAEASRAGKANGAY